MANEEYETKNAIIESAEIVVDDHGLLTGWIHLNYGGSGQGFGGYALYLPKSYKHHKIDSGFAGHWIWRVMEIAGVSEWSKLAGKTIRVKAGWSNIKAIGHIVNNDWFDPSSDFENKEET